MLEFSIGLFIALLVGMTGVGAGVLTAPALLLFLNAPPHIAVGTALVFGGIIKLIAAPNYLFRRQVDYRILGWMLAGGLPGVAIGSVLLSHAANVRPTLIYGILGPIVAVSAALNLWRLIFGAHTTTARDRKSWLPFLAFPIGAEFGFSSAGSGALGSLALMNFTTLPAAHVVGTDVFFGLGLSLLGGGWQFSTGNYDPMLLARLASGGVIGVLVGSYLSSLMPSRPLRFAVSLAVMSVGGQLCWRSLF